MQGLTALLSAVVWTLFTFHIHECSATPSQDYLPQVTYLSLSVLRFPFVLFFFLPKQQGFFFDWNPPGTTVPIPVTRTIQFFFRGGVVISSGC